MLATRAADNGAFVAYANLVGGQDELVFDGQSLIFGPDGQLLARGKQFDEDMVLCDLESDAPTRQRLLDPRCRKWTPSPAQCPTRVQLTPLSRGSRTAVAPSVVAPVLPTLEEVYRALVLATRDYVQKSGFSGVAIGLSGGIDSSLVAVIAADALGAANVLGVAMNRAVAGRMPAEPQVGAVTTTCPAAFSSATAKAKAISLVRALSWGCPLDRLLRSKSRLALRSSPSGPGRMPSAASPADTAASMCSNSGSKGGSRCSDAFGEQMRKWRLPRRASSFPRRDSAPRPWM